MLTNETRRNILNRVRASGYPGGVSEAFRAAEQGIDVVDQFVQQQQLEQQQQAEQAQVQGQQMVEGNQSPPPPPPQNTPDGRVSQPNVNQPIDNNQGHLVQAGDTQNVGIQNLPTGSAQSQMIQARDGGVRHFDAGGLYHNINHKKKSGTSRSKANSTVSKKAYSNMKSGFKKKYETGGDKEDYNLPPRKMPPWATPYFTTDQDFYTASNSEQRDAWRKTVESVGNQRKKENPVTTEYPNYYDSLTEEDNKDYKNITRLYKEASEKVRGQQSKATKENALDYGSGPVHGALGFWTRYKQGMGQNERYTDENINSQIRFVDKVANLSDDDQQNLANVSANIGSEFVGVDGYVGALKALKNVDLSGLKQYREKMGYTKDELVKEIFNMGGDDLAPYNNKVIRGLINMKDFKTGGYKYNHGGEHKEEFPGLLPEVEVSALTDESYNKLSDPQKQVYDTFVTPQGVAQTVDLGDNRSMHYKSALQMTEDLGVKNIYNKPSFVFNKLLNRKKEDNPDFTAHATPILKNVTIPPHSLYKDRSTFGNNIIKRLQDNEGYWAQSMTEQERADEIRRFQDAQTNSSRRAYFKNLIAEYAHIPEFWRKETFINKPVSLAKDASRLMNWAFKKAKNIGPNISLKQATDAPRYADEDHYEYKTHRGPDSFEEQLKNKYEMKKQGGLRRYKQGGLKIKRGYVQKHPHGGFHFNPADFDPNYNQGSVQDNTLRGVNNQAVIASNENEKDAAFYNKLLSNYNASNKKTAMLTPAQQEVLASGNYIGSRAIVNKTNQIPVREDKLIDVNKRNAALLSSHSMLTNQLAGGSGGSNMRRAIEANPEKTEEIYRNVNEAAGQNTMKWLGLGVATAGSGGAGAVPGFGGATNYINHMGRGVDLMSKANRIRPFVKGLFQTGYNATKLTALPTFYNQTGDFGVDLATGNYKDLGQRTMDFGRGVVSNHPAFRKIKDYYKMGQDAYEGNYASVANRMLGLGVKSPGIGKGLEYYTSKIGGRFIPESWQNLGGLPSLKSVFNKYANPKSTTSDTVPPIKAG